MITLFSRQSILETAFHLSKLLSMTLAGVLAQGNHRRGGDGHYLGGPGGFGFDVGGSISWRKFGDL